jgi:hypothetical protein
MTTTRARRLLTVLLLAPLTFACGTKQDPAPVTTQPATAAPGVATTAATTPPPADTGAPAASATAASHSPATLATPPAAAPTPAAATAAPPPATPPEPAPATAASTPAPTTKPEPAAATPAAAPAQRAAERPKGKLTLPAKLGAVTFDHEAHASKQAIACTTCHHPSRPQKPQASENQACRDCHTQPAAAPMKTSLQAAFHDPKGGSGTCIDCHKKHVASAKGGSAPVKCLECHKKK